MHTGIIGGALGYRLLRLIAGSPPRSEACSGVAYQHKSKIETLLGPDVWRQIEGRTVLDFGCGAGDEVIEMARRGAARVIGLDIRDKALSVAREAAARAGVADRTAFVLAASEPVDVVVSVDAFEHFENPRAILETMKGLLKPDGRVLISFGPPWYHPLGGHTFSVFPWAHLLFTEKALIRWRSEFKHDGATRFGEVEGGLNQMTVRRFCRLVRESGMQIEKMEFLAIRRCRRVSKGPTREFLTSTVRCRLSLPPSRSRAADAA